MLPVPAEDWDCGRRIAVSAHVATPGPQATTPVNAARANGGPRGRERWPAGGDRQHLPDRGQRLRLQAGRAGARWILPNLLITCRTGPIIPFHDPTTDPILVLHVQLDVDPSGPPQVQ